jgi:Zn-dependent protease with chaperone function
MIGLGSGIKHYTKLLCVIVALAAHWTLQVTPAHAQDPGKLPGILSNVLQFAMAKQIVTANSRLAYDHMVEATGTVPMPDCVAHVKARMEQALHRTMNLKVLDSKEFNASAYPCGDMFINIGAVNSLHGDEDAIAAILGHEMTHVDKEHSLQHFRKQLAVDTGLRAAISAKDMNNEGIQLLIEGVLMKFSRDDETEADRVGFTYAVRSGFNPDGAAHAMQTIEDLYGGSKDLMSRLMSDHPPIEGRVKKLKEYAAAYRNGVPLDWIAAGKTTAEVEKEIGAPPDVIAYTSVFMDVLMNRPADSFHKSDHPRFAIKAKFNGDLAILCRTPSGSVNRMLPNVYQATARVSEGDTVEVPGKQYRSEKGEIIRLRWDQSGDFCYLFLVTDKPVDFNELTKKKFGNDELFQKAVMESADASGATVLDIAQQKISVR